MKIEVRYCFSKWLLVVVTLLLMVGCTTMERVSGDAAGYTLRGVVYFEKGQYDDAISDYTKALEINPRYAVAFNNRGNAYQGKGQYDQAISDYNKALEINPRFALAYYNRGLAYARKGQHDQAISDYNKFGVFSCRFSCEK